jgi:hypothetical protein
VEEEERKKGEKKQRKDQSNASEGTSRREIRRWSKEKEGEKK